MKAVIWRAFGAARDVLNLEQMEQPKPEPGEVRVRISYSGVNPSDVKARSGARPGVTKPLFNAIIPHSDGSGVIDAVGSNVDPGRVGERVWLWNGQWQRAYGTCSEYICLPQDQAVPLPDTISLETGAVLGIPGLTASHCVFAGGSVKGKAVLVSGGGGSVGYLAVQLAKWGGARVIATCSPSDGDRVKAAGADAVLDYKGATLSEEIQKVAGESAIDLAVEVEFGANAAMLADVMAPNGRVAIYGSAKDMTPTLPFGPMLFKALTLDIVLIYILSEQARAHAIQKLNAALCDNALAPVDPSVFTPENAFLAHEAVETGQRKGPVLVKMD
ncbi:NADPH:quinone reductase [Shimia abyssi]|uniref:NADPH2:quinone reductase n=1 Tax=Shimia abyssi TaxID=1662395 RepID=A0A2P8FDK0_9RHOB|nr:NADPH:quinone reductase [Shimia abyssi]PSL19802.1 NADPH2:quinone reductase [Shimia abyssi]